jgi:coenzyme F420-reducing hydrogenase alpha subunit
MNSGSGIEGGIIINLMQRDNRVSDVSIVSYRPLQTPKIFSHKSVEQTLMTLPLLYSVCGTAQAIAAVQATEQALELTPSLDTVKARAFMLAMETAKEHLWRILLDWPLLLGEAPDHASVAEVTRLQAEARQLLNGGKKPFFYGEEIEQIQTDKLLQTVYNLEMLLQNSIFSLPTEQWLMLNDQDALLSWIAEKNSVVTRMFSWLAQKGWYGLGKSGISGLPSLPEDDLHARLTADLDGEFIAAPNWDGECFETTSFTRQIDQGLVKSLIWDNGNGLLTRLVARLVELARMPGILQSILDDEATCSVVTCSPASGIGLAQVEAARGRLVHRVELDGDIVRRYQILAPTEWNFHPQGVLAKSLIGLQAGSDDELRQQAQLLINAIDPCVGYELRIN